MKFILLCSIFLFSCATKSKEPPAKMNYQCPMECEADRIYSESGTCPVCKMDLKAVNIEDIGEEQISASSIFHLNFEWKTEENKKIRLNDLKGKTLVVVMIYTSCKAACPRLVTDMKNIESKIPDSLINDINFVLVSIDPKTDTAKKLKAFAIENDMNGEQWTFLQGNKKSITTFASVLAVQYKRISPIDFSHSSIISVFDRKGELMHQQEGLGVDSKETIERIIEITEKHN